MTGITQDIGLVMNALSSRIPLLSRNDPRIKGLLLSDINKGKGGPELVTLVISSLHPTKRPSDPDTVIQEVGAQVDEILKGR